MNVHNSILTGITFGFNPNMYSSLETAGEVRNVIFIEKFNNQTSDLNITLVVTFVNGSAIEGCLLYSIPYKSSLEKHLSYKHIFCIRFYRLSTCTDTDMFIS